MWTCRLGWAWPSGYGPKNLLGRGVVATAGSRMGVGRGTGGVPRVSAVGHVQELAEDGGG